MSKKILLVIAMFMVLAAAGGYGSSDEPLITASADKTSVFIGDIIRFSIEADGTGDVKLKFPQFADNKIGDFEIKDSGIKHEKTLFGSRHTTAWFDITAYKTGKHLIPALEVKFSLDPKNDWRSKNTNTVGIIVGSVLPKIGKVSDIKDIKGPIRYFEISWFVALTAAGILLCAVIIFLIYKKVKNNRPVRLPHETALEELESARSNFSRNSDVKEYYVSISDCVRRYIERVFRLKAPEMTTEEFLGSLQDRYLLSMGQKDVLKEFLVACDLVKFARYRPSRAEMEAVYDTAKRFIIETRDTLSVKSTGAKA